MNSLNHRNLDIIKIVGANTVKTYTELNEVFQERPEYVSTHEPVGIKEVPKITINCLEYDDKCLNKY